MRVAVVQRVSRGLEREWHQPRGALLGAAWEIAASHPDMEAGQLARRIRWDLIDNLRKDTGWRRTTIAGRDPLPLADDDYVWATNSGRALWGESLTSDDHLPDRVAVDQILSLLPSRDALILRAWLLDGAYMREIAHALGISESRVSQLAKQALKHCRDHAS